MLRKLSCIFGLMLAGCASHPPVPPLDLAMPPVAVAAQYVTHKSQPHEHQTAAGHSSSDGMSAAEIMVEWRLFRSADRVDIDNLSAATGEVWQRDGKVLIMRKLFHADRKAIEYQMDDFAVLGMQPSWQRQALLIDPAVLSHLTLIDEEWIDGHPVRVYRGTVGDQQLEIAWITDLNLPQSITRRALDGDVVERTALRAMHTLTQNPWRYENGDSYEVIDYADLGDHERDPFVVKVQSQLPGGDVHHH